MGTIVVIAIASLVVYVGFMIYRLVDSWTFAVGQDALAYLDDEAQQLQELAVAKVRTLRDIKDLEFDFQTGHLTEDDYANLRQGLEAKAIEILKKLDALRGEVDYDRVIDTGYEERFGESLAGDAYDDAYEDEPYEDESYEDESYEDASEDDAPYEDSDLEEGGAPEGLEALAEGKPCVSCGHGLNAGARFCNECGTAVASRQFCHDCGDEVNPDDKFCASCGTAVRKASSSQDAPALAG